VLRRIFESNKIVEEKDEKYIIEKVNKQVINQKE
jgi:hypothetical protein